MITHIQKKLGRDHRKNIKKGPNVQEDIRGEYYADITAPTTPHSM